MAEEKPRIAPLRIVYYPDPVLRKTCAPYADDEFGDELTSFGEKMLETMYVARGVGLAAPQVNRSRRLIVIDPAPEQDKGVVLINPRIVAQEGSANELERCLSLPHEGLEARVTRPEWVRCAYRTPHGEEESVEGDGLWARVLQHEIDHLDGVLFIDHASSIRKMTLRKYLRELEVKYG